MKSEKGASMKLCRVWGQYSDHLWPTTRYQGWITSQASWL
jgi:hypothetical protein